MIGRFWANLTGVVAAMAGQPARLANTLYADTHRQTPLLLTGFTSNFTLDQIAGDGTATRIFTASTANGGITLTGNVVTLDTSGMSPAPTIPAGTHRYTWELFNASGHLELICSGEWLWDEDRSP